MKQSLCKHLSGCGTKAADIFLWGTVNIMAGTWYLPQTKFEFCGDLSRLSRHTVGREKEVRIE